jgi:DNA polymerase
MSSPASQLRAYVDYLRDLGIYDLYHRADPSVLLPDSLRAALAANAASAAPIKPATPPAAAAVAPAARQATPEPPRPAPPVPPTSYFPADTAASLPQELLAPMPKPKSFDELVPLPTAPIADKAAALAAVRAEIGDCTRCPLAYAGRRHIVFADGDPNARLMFVGEGPGADEDETGTPFVGKAGQLLNNMIGAMGLKREEVYIANIVKCRPPANRTPEFVEATTCSQFLIRQIDIVRPQVIVALGATAATYLLGVKQSLASLRGTWHTSRGAKVAVTYHPAFLLRDPRQKGEAWKDLQRVMAELGLTPPARPTAAS